MPRDLFGEVARPAVRAGRRSWCGLPLTVLVHAAVIAAAVIVPLFAANTLPPLPGVLAYRVQIAPSEPRVAPPSSFRPAAARLLAASLDAAPVAAPEGIAPDSGLVREPDARTEAGVPGGLPGSIEGTGLWAAPEGPPPAPQPAVPVRITSTLERPAKIKDVTPVYPELALRAHVEGTVILEATINAEGQVIDVRVLRSVPLLDRAAVDAVRQWMYRPTRLNGVAVPVVMSVSVTFALSR
jgi:protein TonB